MKLTNSYKINNITTDNSTETLELLICEILTGGPGLPIKLCGPHLDFEMWETMSPPLFVLSNSGFQSFPGLKIQTWEEHSSPRHIY